MDGVKNEFNWYPENGVFQILTSRQGRYNKLFRDQTYTHLDSWPEGEFKFSERFEHSQIYYLHMLYSADNAFAYQHSKLQKALYCRDRLSGGPTTRYTRVEITWPAIP